MKLQTHATEQNAERVQNTLNVNDSRNSRSLEYFYYLFLARFCFH